MPRDVADLVRRTSSAGTAALLAAAEEAGRVGELAGPRHLLLALALDGGPVGGVLAACGVTPSAVRELVGGPDEPPDGSAPSRASEELGQVVDTATALADALGEPEVVPAHLLAVLASPHPWAVGGDLLDLGADPLVVRQRALATS